MEHDDDDGDDVSLGTAAANGPHLDELRRLEK
jgi:hypothetical protein